MRTSSAILLTLQLTVAVDPGAQASASQPGPIAGSLRRLSASAPPAAADPASQPLPRPPVSDWASVLRLAPGSEIQLTRDGGPPARRHVVSADREALLVLNLGHPALTSSVRETLLELARIRPDALAAARHGVPIEHQDVRIAADGITVANRRIAALDDVLEMVRRGDVTEIRGAPVRHGSRFGALVGGVGGFVLGLRAAGYLAFKQCGSSCKDEGALMLASLVGLPVGGGLLGWHGLARTTRPLIYRRD